MPALAERKPSSGPDLALGQELADLGLLHFPAADHLVDDQLAVLGLVAAEGLAQRLAVGRREDVGLAGAGSSSSNFLTRSMIPSVCLDHLGHELLPRKLAVLHLAELELPFAGHVGAGDLLGLDRRQELQDLLGLRRRHELALRRSM